MTEEQVELGLTVAGKKLSALTDAELQEEVQRRRRARSMSQGHLRGEPATPSTSRVTQFFANLELSTDATLQDVERAYKRMVDKYRPFASSTDSKRREAAKTLLASLEKAVAGLRDHFKAR